MNSVLKRSAVKSAAFAVFLALALPLPAAADLYRVDRPLKLASTRYFDLIYPPESAGAAAYLASFADRAYEEIAAALGTKPSRRYPVVMTADHEVLNGYYTQFPYPRIVLYQAATDVNGPLGSFQDDLYKLFYHELTHAVSLSIRHPGYEAMVRIFGSPFGLSFYTTPLSFIEGVTVSFESLDGHGRAADPLAAAVIRQDILEGSFKRFNEASGAWDGYPYGLYYLYGGYFSRYLQKRFGMERYARLWKHIGDGAPNELVQPYLFMRGHFYKAYGIELEDAWAEFGEAMAIRSPVVMAAERLRPLSRLSALAVHGSTAYFYDAAKGELRALELESGAERRLFRAAYGIGRVEPSPDGERLLISGVDVVAGGFSRYTLWEYELRSGRLTKLPYAGLRDAAYAPDGSIVAVKADGYETALVQARGGAIAMIMSGSRNLSYASPRFDAGGQALYALAKLDGAVSLVLLPWGSGEGGADPTRAELLMLPEGLGALRYLGPGRDGLLMAWNDDELYRLVELRADTIRYQTISISGGLHEPFVSGDRIYYLGRFSAGETICVFPADEAALGFQESPARWRPFPWEAVKESAYRPGSTSPDAIPARPYSVLPWLLPRFWHPGFTVDEDGFTSVGALFYIADPIERFSMILAPTWFVNADAPGLALQADYARGASYTSLKLEERFDGRDDELTRRSAASLALGLSLPTLKGGAWRLEAQALAIGEARADEGGPRPAWSLGLASAAASVAWSDYRLGFGRSAAPYGYGVRLVQRGAVALHDADRVGIGIEAAADAAVAEPLPLSLGLEGAYGLGEAAYSPAGLSIAGAEASAPYQRLAGLEAPPSRAYVQGRLELEPVRLAAGAGRGLLYLNALSLAGGVRAFASLDDAELVAWDYAVYARLKLTLTPAIGIFALARPILYAELWHRPRDGATGFSAGISAAAF